MSVLASSEPSHLSLPLEREGCSDYVAQLQLHMTLQARNLVPSLHQERDRRSVLLHQTQADVEKMISRQGF